MSHEKFQLNMNILRLSKLIYKFVWNKQTENGWTYWQQQVTNLLWDVFIIPSHIMTDKSLAAHYQ